MYLFDRLTFILAIPISGYSNYISELFFWWNFKIISFDDSKVIYWNNKNSSVETNEFRY